MGDICYQLNMWWRSVPSWVPLTRAKRWVPAAKKRKIQVWQEKKDRNSKNATADVWQGSMRSPNSSQKWKYLLITMFVEHKNSGNKTLGRNTLTQKTYISTTADMKLLGLEDTHVRHVLQQCKVISACYWSTWYFFVGFLRQDIFFSNFLILLIKERHGKNK